jgi:hypothetical protein
VFPATAYEYQTLIAMCIAAHSQIFSKRRMRELKAKYSGPKISLLIANQKTHFKGMTLEMFRLIGSWMRYETDWKHYEFL